MATVTQENIAPQIDKLIVKIQKDEYFSDFEKSLRQYAKKANIQGFRQGMAPASLIKKMYGEAIFNEQVIKKVDDEINKYIQDNKLEILAQPLPVEGKELSLDMNEPKDYEFEFEIGLQPKVEVDVKNINVKRYKVEITDKMVDEEIDHVRLRSGKYTTPETIDAETQDTIINADAEAGEHNGHATFTLKDIVKTQQEKFVGKKIDDTVTVRIDEVFEEKNIQERILNDLGLSKEEKENFKEDVTLRITKIGLLTKAELNEELFKKVYPAKEIKTEAEFRDAMKEDLSQYYDQQASSQINDQIFHYLTEHTKMDFPEAFLKRWIVVNSEGKKTAEDADKEYPDFVKQLQWALISTKLSSDNNIKVEQSELNAFARNQLMSYVGGQIDENMDNTWMDEYVNRVMSDQKYLEEAYGQIRISKLFTALETQVNATEVPISEHDFAELLHEHEHEHHHD